MTILSVYREPFGGFMPVVARLPGGLTLSEMIERMPGLPDDFSSRGVVCVNGHAVPQSSWPLVRPRAPAVTEVTFHTPLRDGGEDGKSVFALVASIALTVATGWIAGGGIAARFGTSLFTANSVSALALAAGVSLVGSLLVSALVPPPALQNDRSVQNPGAASATGNVLQTNAPVPRVIGERKVYPPMGMEPFTYFDGPDEIVEAAYVLAGPHSISDVRLGAASVVGVPDIDYEVREGWPGDDLLSLVRKQSRTESVQSELRGHIVSDADGRTLESVSGGVLSSLPQAQVLATSDSPDEHQIQIIFAQGLHKNASETQKVRVPLRIRIRMVGEEDWINLPELHFQASSLRQLRATVRLVWTQEDPGAPSAASSEGWVEARVSSPGQTEAPSSAGWDADSSFYSGSGDVWQIASNLGSTGVVGVAMDRYTTSLFMDDAVFPRGRYEIEVSRGAAFLLSEYSPSAYTVDGDVWDLWGYQGTPGEIVMSRDGLMDSLYILRSVSVWNEHPLPSRDLAAVAVRARNRSVDRVSCVAGGWVRDWDGSGWSNWTVTDNPAPHLRDIWVGSENQDPVPEDLIDNDGMVEWRQHCIDMGYTCNALIEDQSVDDASRIVAACGYAKPYTSDVWGVVVDRDRSLDSPTQMFTPRNMSNFQWTKAFAKVPDGFRVNFRDKTRDYEVHQISVFRSGVSDDSGRVEQITIEGLVDEEDVVRRAEYDHMQAERRNTFYSGDVSAEVILCRRGDLVAVQHDVMSEFAGSARISSVELDVGGDVEAITLDAPVPVTSYPYLDDIDDLDLESDLSRAGNRPGVAIRRSTGVTLHPVSDSVGNRIEFSPPISASGLFDGGDLLDSLVSVGSLGSEYRRLIVFSVTPRPNFEATITMVDEAPELWS